MNEIDHSTSNPQTGPRSQVGTTLPSRCIGATDALGDQPRHSQRVDEFKDVRRGEGCHSKRSAVAGWCAHSWKVIKQISKSVFNGVLCILGWSFLLGGAVGAWLPIFWGVGHDTSIAQAALGVGVGGTTGYVLWSPTAGRARVFLLGAMKWIGVFVAVAIATRGLIDSRTITLGVVVAIPAALALWRARRLDQAVKQKELYAEAKEQAEEIRRATRRNRGARRARSSVASPSGLVSTRRAARTLRQCRRTAKGRSEP